MTRESLKEYYMQIVDAPSPSNRWLPKIVCEHIDIIYDDFKSRTCENCMYFQENTNRYGEYEGTCHNDIQEERALGTVRKDFGCNKFERKDK